ncbi:ABC transporter substrate-binding protein [Bacillus solitudinis]|uniref:ABC transporter substrate-binding protein n=1 Tax=Bacillus solitudinis TaxID=2014074 RepID=UPI000C24897B|nr:extracellular solute-binding protein [Bacillus solitudinis]
MVNLRNYKLGILIAVLSLVMFLVACNNRNEEVITDESNTGNDVGETEEAEKGTITMWGWDTNYIDVVRKEFNKVYPEIEIELTTVDANDYLQKIQTTLASGGELPDVLWGELNFRGKMFEFDIWENLEEAPYNVDRSEMFDYLPALTSNPQGDIVGIEQSVSPAGLAYRKDLALEYFGTDDREELEKMFPTIDAMIEKGKEVREKSDGQVYMFASLGELNEMVSGQSQVPLMNGEVVDVTRKMGGALETLVKIRDAGIVDKLEQWSPQWNASFANGNHIFYPSANWAPQYVIKPNDSEGEGRWGLMKAPDKSYNWGGTVLGISKTSENKELAWTFIEWLLLTEEGAEASKLVNFFVPIKSVYEDPEFASSVDPFFDGQDVGRFWMEEVVPELDLPVISGHDAAVKDSTILILNLINSDRNVDADEALVRLISEVEGKLPDVEVK